jgi:hypothetical protein
MYDTRSLVHGRRQKPQTDQQITKHPEPYNAEILLRPGDSVLSKPIVQMFPCLKQTKLIPHLPANLLRIAECDLTMRRYSAQ